MKHTPVKKKKTIRSNTLIPYRLKENAYDFLNYADNFIRDRD